MTKCIVLRHASYRFPDDDLDSDWVSSSQEKGKTIRNTIENFSDKCTLIITSTTPRAKQTWQHIAQWMWISDVSILTTEHLCENGDVDLFLEFLKTLTLPMLLIIITHQPRVYRVAQWMWNVNKCSYEPYFLEWVEFELNVNQIADSKVVSHGESFSWKSHSPIIPVKILDIKSINTPSHKILKKSVDDLKVEYEKLLDQIVCWRDSEKIAEDFIELWIKWLPYCSLDKNLRKEFLFNKILSHKFNQKLIWVYNFLTENAPYMSDDQNKFRLLTYFISCELVYIEEDNIRSDWIILEWTMRLIIEWIENREKNNQEIPIWRNVEKLINSIDNVLLGWKIQLGLISYIDKLHFYSSLSNPKQTITATKKIRESLSVLFKTSILQDLKWWYGNNWDTTLVFNNLANDLYDLGYLWRDLDISFDDPDPLIIKQRIRQITMRFLKWTDVNFYTPKKYEEYEWMQLFNEWINPEALFEDCRYELDKYNYYYWYINKFSTVISGKTSIELVKFIFLCVHWQFRNYLNTLPNSSYFFEIFDYGDFLEEDYYVKKHKAQDVLEYLLKLFGNILIDSNSSKYINLDNFSELVRNMLWELQLHHNWWIDRLVEDNFPTKKRKNKGKKWEITEEEFRQILEKNEKKKKYYPSNKRVFSNKKIYKENTLPCSEDFTLTEPTDLF